MRQLGEMIVEEPVAGSFSHFAHKYWGGFAGFMSGWNYWVLYILVGMSELTAVGKYIQFWWPDFPTWATAAVFFVLINAINLFNVKAFGETEFWFAIIKVVAIIGMILLGVWLLVSGAGGPQASVSNLWAHGGFFPNGWKGLIMVLAIIMFSFGGLELVGITAAEASEPKKVIPKAINQVIYRILIFYIGALAVLLSLYPWDALLQSINSAGDPYSGSPFVKVFSLLGSEYAANILNFVVLTAALSVYNSCVYCNSRMLYGLAEQGDAPRAFAKVDDRGVPLLAIGVSAFITLACVVVNYVIPHQFFFFFFFAGDQLGDDQPGSHQVPQGHGGQGRAAVLPRAVVPLRQLAVPGLRGVHPGHHAADPWHRRVGVCDPGVDRADGRLLFPVQAQVPGQG